MGTVVDTVNIIEIDNEYAVVASMYDSEEHYKFCSHFSSYDRAEVLLESVGACGNRIGHILWEPYNHVVIPEPR